MDLRLEQFCPICGCILNILARGNAVKCFRKNCSYSKERKIGDKDEKFSCTVLFPKKIRKSADASTLSGPQIEYQCPACNYHLATYIARQMRSADEGQTVFYMCLQCKHVTREE